MVNQNLSAPHNPNLTIELTTEAFKIIIGEELWYNLVQSNQIYLEMIDIIKEINQVQKDLKSGAIKTDAQLLQHQFQEIVKRFFKNLEQFETENMVLTVEKRVGFETEKEIKPNGKEDWMIVCRRDIVQKKIRIMLDIHEAALSLKNELSINDVNLSGHIDFLDLNKEKEAQIDFFTDYYQATLKEVFLLKNFEETLKKIMGDEAYEKIKLDPKKIIEQVENAYITYNQKYINLCNKTFHRKIKLNQTNKDIHNPANVGVEHGKLLYDEYGKVVELKELKVPITQQITKDEIKISNDHQELRAQGMKDGFEAGNRGAIIDTTNQLSLAQLENTFPNQNQKTNNQKYVNEVAYTDAYQVAYQKSYEKTILEQAAILGKYQGMYYGISLVEQKKPYVFSSLILEPKYQKFNGTKFAQVYLQTFNESGENAYYQFEEMLAARANEYFEEEQIITSRKK